MNDAQTYAFAVVTLMTFLSGAVGTGLGGVIGAICKTESNKITSLLLAFAGGVMTSIVCFSLLTEAVDAAQKVMDAGVIIVIGGVLVGILVVYGIGSVIEKHVNPQVEHRNQPDHPKVPDDVDELTTADHWRHHKEHGSRKELMAAGVIMGIAIAIHNIPEGMTIGASFAISDDLLLGTGMMMAVLIGLHNMPEGMAVSVPLIAGGMGRVKAVLLTAASGLPTVLGAWLGLWLGDIGPLGLTLSLSLASGAMLYVVFAEIVPEAILMYRSKTPAFAIIIGMMLGLVLMYI